MKVLSLGLAKPKASAAEIEDRRHRKLIRETSWPRSVSIGVVNEKGGSGKTPTSLALAGALASIRGGGVVAFDAAQSRNGLDRVAEGRPARCISELVDDPASFATPGRIAAFAARQTSFADVICSLRERPFDGDSVKRVRYAIDRCYAMSIADTGNAHEDPSWVQVAHSSDLLVIPVVPSVQSIEDGLKILRLLREDQTWVPVPVIVSLMHPGGQEVATAEQILGDFHSLGVAATVEIPYDPAIAGGRRITLGDLTHASQVAWTRLAAAVVANIYIKH